MPGLPFSETLRAGADDLWRAQLAHPFLRGIAGGSLDPERFRHFIRQDYLFLVDYARLLSLASARAPRLDWQDRLARIAVETLTDEMALHRGYAASWDVAAVELESERPGPTTRAYTDFLLRTASLGDFADAVAVLLPCVWGYSWLGQELAVEPEVEGNPFASWIATYADPEFAALAGWCREVVDAIALEVGEATRARMREAFLGASRHELAFWDASWRLEPA